jgi:hypothetical protein
LVGQQVRDSHEVIGEHGRPDQQLEAISPVCETPLHAATSQQHRDAPFDAGAKALTLLELRALLVSLAFRRSLACGVSLDDLVGTREQHCWDFKFEGLRGF